MQFDQSPNGGWSYTTVDGDVVDLVAFNFYGFHKKTTAAILEANPGLAAMGPILSAGVVIRLPEVDTAPNQQTQISLWD